MNAAEVFATPAFTCRSGDAACVPNSSARSWLEERGLPVADNVILTDIFLPVLEGETVSSLAVAADEQNAPSRARFRLRGPAGDDIIEVLVFPLRDEAEHTVCLLPMTGNLGDPILEESRISLSVLAEERTAELIELNRFLAAIVDSSTETFIIALGRNGYVLSFNEGAHLVFGYTGNDSVGRMHASELFESVIDARERWHEMAERAQQDGKSREMVNLKRSDGSVFPALVDLTVLLNAEHQALGTLLVGRDMTESIATQRALEERTEQLEFLNQLALETGQTLEFDSIIRIALDHLVRKFNALAGGAFRRLQDEQQTLKLIETIPSSGSAAFIPILAPSVEDQILVEEGEVLIREVRMDDQIVQGPMFRLMLPLHQKSSFIGEFVLLLDTYLQRSDELLNFLSAITATVGSALENAILYDDSLQKSIEIKKQNQELDEFAYVVSHDLKEPLAGISFISNLITDEYFDKMDETGKTYVNSLIDFSKRLGSLIDALLDLSRIGRITHPPERVDLSDVLFDVRQNLSYRMASHNIELIVQPGVPVVFGDKTRIEQVFFNLVSNACKFNDKNTIRVEVGWQEREDDFIEFHVRDNGIGIEPVYFDKIFKIFERLNPREEYEGTGAGLTIVKKIVEHHGGVIWLESELDVGTTFFFTLPKVKEST